MEAAKGKHTKLHYIPSDVSNMADILSMVSSHQINSLLFHNSL